MDQLQKEAFERLGLTGLPPATDAGDRRRSGVPTEVSDEILSLPPGHVSKVEQEAYSFVIYKVEAKRKLPLAQVRDEIAREISREKLRQALEAITSRMQMHLSESYFGPNGQ
jgi:hypothetical protein